MVAAVLIATFILLWKICVFVIALPPFVNLLYKMVCRYYNFSVAAQTPYSLYNSVEYSEYSRLFDVLERWNLEP